MRRATKTFYYLAIIIIMLLSALINSPVILATSTTLASPTITEIYPNAPGSSEIGQEFIELYNSSSTDVDLSIYVLQIKDKPAKAMNLSGVLPAGLHKSFITSFSLVNSGETIQLLKDSEVIEEVTYSSGAAENESWSYFEGGWELAPITKDLPNQKNPIIEPEPVDVCPMTPAIDSSVPPGYEIDSGGVCVQIVDQPTGSCVLEISEISAQPNYLGQEYIELFNPTSEVMSANLCKLKINDGAERVLEEASVDPGGYHVVPYSSGIIRNSAGSVSLINSLNEELKYAYFDTLLGQTINYDQSLLGILSDKPTPGALNELVYLNEEELATQGTSLLSDCGPGKFRNPATNRCKSIDENTANLQSCDAGQERNPDTNRCRKLSNALSSLAPCKEDQERNPETNRCRKIGASDIELKPCDIGQERNPETNRCRKIASAVSGSSLAAAADPAAISPMRFKTPLIIGLITAALGYALYEYRTDVSNKLIQVREHFRRTGLP